MRTAFDGVDIVHIRENALAVSVVVLEGDIDRNHLVGGHADGIRDEFRGAGIQVVDEFLQAFLRVEDLGAVGAVLEGLAQVRQGNADAFVQECQFTQTLGQGVVFVHDGLRKDLGVRMEGDDGTRVVAGTHDLDRSQGFSLGIFLDVDLSLAVHLGHQQVGQGVHAGYAHAVQTAGHLVAVLAELTAGVQDGQNDLQGTAVLLGVHARRDTAAVILYRDGVVLVDADFDFVAEAGHRFVDTVIHDLVHQVVKTPFTDVADIHGRAFAHGLQAFENLDTTGRILLFRLLHFLIFNHIPFCIIITCKDSNLFRHHQIYNLKQMPAVKLMPLSAKPGWRWMVASSRLETCAQKESLRE